MHDDVDKMKSVRQTRTRKWIAVGICVGSATLTLAFWHGGGRAWLALSLLSSVWGFTADWLGERLWALHKTPREIYQTIRENGRSVLRLPPLAKTIARGATILSIASLATCVLGPEDAKTGQINVKISTAPEPSLGTAVHASS